MELSLAVVIPWRLFLLLRSLVILRFLAYYNHITQQLRQISDQPIYITLLSDAYRLGARHLLCWSDIYDKFDRFLEVEVLFILRGASIARVLGEPVDDRLVA